MKVVSNNRLWLAWCAAFCILCQPIFGQTAQRGKVTVLSATDNAPVSTAVVVFTAISPVEKGNPQSVPTSAAGIAQNPYDGKTAVFIYAIGFDKIVDTLAAGQSKTYNARALSVKLNDVIVTGQYGANTADKSVYKIRVIDEAQIKAQGAVNLRDMLVNQLNIRLSQDNILGSAMSMQGVSGENVKILVDGVPMVGRQNGNIDLSQINLNNIERIEIVEGPLSVSYGTNALGGAINLITKKEQKNTTEARGSFYYESIGQYNADGRIGISKGKHNLQLSGGRNFFDGYAIVDTSRFKTWKPKEQYFGNLGYGYNFKALTLRYSGEYFWELITNRGQRRQPYYETAFDDYYRTQRINNSVTLNGKVSKYNINVIAAYNLFLRHKNTYFKNLVDLSQELTVPDEQDTSRMDLIMSRGTISTSKQRLPGKNGVCNFEAGYDINVESFYGKRIDGKLQTIGDYAVFVSAEYSPIPKLTFRPGVRFAYNSAYAAPIIPSINILFNNNKGLTLRASYARGFRAPSIKELYFNFVDINHNIIGSQNLKAEYSHNFSANVACRQEIGKSVIKGDISGFYNQIDNLITLVQLDPTAVQYTYGNIGKYKTLGGTAQVDYWVGKFRVGAGFNYVGRTGVTDGDSTKLKFYYSPEVRGTASFIAEKAGLNISVFYKYTGRIQTFIRSAEGEILENYIYAFNTLDATVSKYFWKRHINLTVGAKNLLNVQNVQANISSGVHSGGGNSVPMGWGRTYFVKLELNFWK